jgi:FkbM family methyltransferase
MDFSSIPRESSVGRVLRAPLALLPKALRVPVLQGPLRGASWVVGAHTHGCWLGSYELDKQHRFATLVRGGDVVYDVGANAGFYTLLAARLVGHGGRVVAFEPLPRNLSHLREHVRINRLDNVQVLDVAVAARPGHARFHFGGGAAQGALADAGELEVRTTSLDALVAASLAPPPTLIKMDIEGGELEALRGAHAVLSAHRPVLLLATHGPAVHAACLALLREHGYRVESLDGRDVNATDELMASPG